jgi:uncharacterized membrane protein YkvA (DUF1232 family)
MTEHEDTGELDEGLHDAAEAGAIPHDRADHFYRRVRTRIQQFLDRKGGIVGQAGEYLLLVPDVFNLLWRLVNDPRVNGRNKVLLGSGVAYFVFPFDILPEALMGPMGYLDDLVFAVYVLNRVLVDTDASIVREHWAGDGDVLGMIQRVLQAADTLVSTEVLGRIKKMAK